MPKRHTSRFRGFTLTEILIIVALLGALFVGLLVTVDPFEQLKKGADASVSNTANNFYNAIVRTYASAGKYPWASDVIGIPLSSTQGETIIQTLATAGELKSNFSKFASAELDNIYLTASKDGKKLSICFQPDSKSYKSGNLAIYDRFGDVADCSNTPCYICTGQNLTPITLTSGSEVGTCRASEAECEINNTEKACCKGLTCVRYNWFSNNGKCQVEPSSTPTPTSEQRYCPAPVSYVGKPCTGQLLTNGSFETDVNNDQLPDGWDPQISSSVIVRPGEGVQCDDASSGACSYSFLPWISPWSPIKIPELRQALSISGDTGTILTLSADAKSTVEAGGSNQIDVSLTFYYTDNTMKTFSMRMNKSVNYEWTYGTKSVIAEKPFTKVSLTAFIGPGTSSNQIDNICLTRAPVTTPAPTPVLSTSDCPGQLFQNGSFEQESAIGQQYPLYWNQISQDIINHVYPTEGRSCLDSTDGSWSYHIYPFYYPKTTDLHQQTLQQSVATAGLPGDTVTVTLDGRLVNPVLMDFTKIYSNAITLELFPTDGLIGSDKTTYSLTNWQKNIWERKMLSLKATRPFNRIYLTVGQPINPQEMFIDGLCVTKSP